MFLIMTDQQSFSQVLLTYIGRVLNRAMHAAATVYVLLSDYVGEFTLFLSDRHHLIVVSIIKGEDGVWGIHPSFGGAANDWH